jgi:dephospho-CoA kinase
VLKVGLTGGLASGKSFVASCFARWGAHVLHADEAGHAVLEPGGEAYAGVVAEFGDAILRPDSTIERKALGAIVFADPAKLEKLNALVHPHVFARQQAFFEEVERKDPTGVAVVEAAIMVETGSYKRYGRLVLAVCPPEVQIQRFVEREGASEEAARARMARQMPLADKIPFADYLIDTSGTKDETVARARAVWEKLKAEAAGRKP